MWLTVVISFLLSIKNNGLKSFLRLHRGGWAQRHVGPDIHKDQHAIESGKCMYKNALRLPPLVEGYYVHVQPYWHISFVANSAVLRTTCQKARHGEFARRGSCCKRYR